MAGTITALVVQKRNKERVNVYIDGEYAFGLAAIEAIKLHKGQRLSSEEIAQLQAIDRMEAAYERTLDFLARRPRSEQELRYYLRGRKVTEETIDRVIARLESAGLVDDEAFARYWVESRERSKPISERALRYELRKKGVPDATIAAVLEAVDEEALATRAALEMAPRFRNLDRTLFRKRLGAALLRRGFAYSVVREATDRLWAELVEEGSVPPSPSDPDYGSEE